MTQQQQQLIAAARAALAELNRLHHAQYCRLGDMCPTAIASRELELAIAATEQPQLVEHV